eukprot:SM000042S15306  [mRNA]  locus=s42:278670:279953:- [translate_table: standard]
MAAAAQAAPAAVDIEAAAEGGAGHAACSAHHYVHRAPWLRAALLGANDGLVSVASLLVGVGAVRSDARTMLLSGVAGLVAGALSMAIGEYVSVYGQRDTEEADIQKERDEHARGPEARQRELEELTAIYVGRGLSHRLAKEVAVELSSVDAVKAHVRDELGIDVDDLSNPTQAALASAAAFSVGALFPLLSAAFIAVFWIRLISVVIASTVALALFGVLGAVVGGAKMLRAGLRSVLGGWLAMLITYGILRLVQLAGFQ